MIEFFLDRKKEAWIAMKDNTVMAISELVHLHRFSDLIERLTDLGTARSDSHFSVPDNMAVRQLLRVINTGV